MKRPRKKNPDDTHLEEKIPNGILNFHYRSLATAHNKWGSKFGHCSLMKDLLQEALVGIDPNYKNIHPDWFGSRIEYLAKHPTENGYCWKKNSTKRKVYKFPLPELDEVSNNWYRNTYLPNSPRWARIRLRALEKCGYRCVLCNLTWKLDCHHRSYEWCNRGPEDRELEDVWVLCGICHPVFHGKKPKKGFESELVTQLHHIENMIIDELPVIQGELPNLLLPEVTIHALNGEPIHCDCGEPLCKCGMEGRDARARAYRDGSYDERMNEQGYLVYFCPICSGCDGDCVKLADINLTPKESAEDIVEGKTLVQMAVQAREQMSVNDKSECNLCETHTCDCPRPSPNLDMYGTDNYFRGLVTRPCLKCSGCYGHCEIVTEEVLV